jgi:hypothetical protein
MVLSCALADQLQTGTTRASSPSEDLVQKSLASAGFWLAASEDCRMKIPNRYRSVSFFTVDFYIF